jgi:transcriptional regulator with GAF, ATPase, and Fis domain
LSGGQIGGRLNGRWRLLRLLGEGADATTWAAIDERDDRPVALKALRRLGSAEARERFRWEFARLSAIEHPNLVRVFDLALADPGGPLVAGQPFFTAELCDGPTVREHVTGLPPRGRARALAQLLAEVGSALEALHRRGLLHHDVKPGNLLLDGSGTFRLSDLGLATARSLSDALRGTPAYLAPEGFGGAASAGTDLYALGATAWELWTGEPLRRVHTLAELIAEASRAAPDLAQTATPPPTRLAQLVARLLAIDPAERPSSARAVAEEAVRLGARLDGALLEPPTTTTVVAPRLQGRASELARAVELLPTAALVLIAGEPGSGRSRFVDELRRRAQVSALTSGDSPRGWHGPTLLEAARTLRDDDHAPLGSVDAGRILARLRQRPAVLHLDLSSGVDALHADLLALVARGAARPSTVVVEAAPTLAIEGAARIDLGPLDEAATTDLVASMLGARDPALGRAVHRAAHGRPRVAVELVRAAALRARPGERPTSDDVRAVDTGDLADLVAAALERLSAPARDAVFALAVVERPAGVDELAAVLEQPAAAVHAALREAEALGVVELDGTARFPARAHADAVRAALPAKRQGALHRRALVALPEVTDRARHLLALNDPSAAGVALDAAAVARTHGDRTLAAGLYAETIARGRPDVARAGRLALAELYTSSARYAEALSTLEPLRPADGEAELTAARALQRSGDAASAEAALRRLLEAPLEPARNADARGLLGRVLLARGAYAEIVDICRLDGDSTAPLAEARGLALLYLGRPDEAEAAFRVVGDRAADDGARARAQSLLGMVAQMRDELPAAAVFYQRALELGRAAGDLHAGATYAANLGATLREQAEYERALGPTEEAARELGWLGKDAERANALSNYGNLLLSMGDPTAAATVAEEALAIAQRAAAPREAGYARLLAADVARRAGDPSGAVEHCRAALADFDGAGAVERLVAVRNLAEAEAEAGQGAAARRHLDQAASDAGRANQLDLVALPQVKLRLDLGERPDRAAVIALETALERALATHRRDLAFRAAVTLARAHVRAGETRRALECLDRASQTWKEILMRTPELRRDAASEDPDARRLRELTAAVAAHAAPSAPAAAPVDGPPFRRLLAINKRLNSELRLPRLLELILDTVIDLTSAERGFILLADAAGNLQVSLARNIDQRTLETAAEGQAATEASFSRSIAERAAREAAPIVTLDAAGDERFEAARSVSHLKLRSVLAVPLAVKGRVVGCVYADHRLRAGAFGDADVQLVCDLAEQAAIAIENARLLEENDRQRREVAELARELERKVQDQALELGELHREVRSNRAALSVRYNYDNLVGRTPRMLELFRLLDRVTDTALPVVIYGESGTGKELVARAIHHNGPRRTRPFVSESCAAIPETLLEAALFGHVRGAFTGADAERRGLFEIAHGGTLFLDEVGEMPASMQAKLLRVLQTGEFRRVGGERTLKVDVRLLVASNRDLGRLVEEGRFREDLFYRLNVVRVALPPLRERRDDVPLLVEHFLRKQAEASGGEPRRIARAALQKLIGYRWPGNVRELENEVIRAASLGGDVITVADLSPQVAAGEPEAAVDSPDDLTVKTRVERLERTLLREALSRADGNQSQAARMLGLSRFGLQKKLKRYRMEP